MRHSIIRPGERRDGVVLLVVIAMLALFASVGLGFVFYAESEATASQLSRLSVVNPNPDSDPELLLSYFLSQFIYDTDNEYSAMRGHSLARLMYGYNPATLNFTPFNGPGRQHFANATLGVGIDDYLAINYQRHDVDPFVRTPEFVNGKYVAGANVPWTAPDLNNMFLALVSANGEVIQPSFRRDWSSNNPPPGLMDAKYRTLRPHSSYHTLFPAMEDAGGDVRNFDFGRGTRLASGTYANNDSIWMDLGFPVLTAPNGRRYKPLFAPLIVDLDSRLNLWATGNLLGGGGTTHVSNQGYGATEINLGAILTDATERQNFLKFRNATLSGTPAGMRPGRYYSLLDFDGLNPGAGASSARLALPGTSSFSVAPTYPAGWDNVNQNATSVDERIKHPLSLDFMKAVGSVDAKPFNMANMEALMRFMGRNAPAVTSELFKRMPNTLSNNRSRNLMTLMSWHFDRIAATPFLTNDPSATTSYRYDPLKKYAAYTPSPSPDPQAGIAFPNSEYGADWRSTLGRRLRINLNRPLTDYPLPDPVTGLIDTTNPAFAQAENDRITLVRDLYAALLAATGAQDPNKVAALTRVNVEFQAARWLAQLAVNIVDYLDNDDTMTSFLWYTNPSDNTDFEYVHGTEMPRLVLNEAYAQYDNDAQDKGILDPLILKAQDGYRLNFWIELLNPHNTTPTLVPAENYPLEQGRVRLHNDSSPIYQIVVVQDDAGVPPYLRSPDNVRGEPDTTPPTPGKVLTVMDNWDKTDLIKNFVLPSNGKYQGTAGLNEGFYVVGPVGPDPAKALLLPGRDPNIATTYKSNRLSVSRKINDPALASPTVVLRRLANPYLPLQPAPGKNYNPYITVDYIEKLQYFDGRVYDDTGLKGVAPAAVTTFNSFGRAQPFAASTLVAQNPINPLPNQPKHTFYRHNAIDDLPPLTTMPAGAQTLQDPFDWLVHLDRPVVNALELLHVSCYKPHELTQMFNGAAGKFGHRAPWLQPESLLYRFLDLAGSPPQLAGTAIGGKQPGRINLNTMLEWEVFQALCDPRDAAELATAKTIFANLNASRGYGVDVNTSTYTLPVNEGRPFKNLATGYVAAGDVQYPNGSGIQDTLLRTINPGELLFAPGITAGTPGFHPIRQLELAQKIFNNTTTVSNVFGVWVTVGFFEVVDETVNPPRLGVELGRDEGRHVRHRMFAIVDRSELKLFNTTSSAAVAAGKGATMGLTQTNGTMSNGKAWSVQPGMLLEINSAAGSEVVAVQSIVAGGFTADFTLSHPVNAAVIGRGNPGPQTRYNPRADTAVVPHYSVIE